jgi:hypothetical protein
VKRSFVLTPEATADLREILLDIAEDSVAAAIASGIFTRMLSAMFGSGNRSRSSPWFTELAIWPRSSARGVLRTKAHGSLAGGFTSYHTEGLPSQK